MSKLRQFWYICLLIPFLASCVESPPSRAEAILKGEHQLRKMVEKSGVLSSFSGSYFLFAGSVEGTSRTTLDVKFAWELSDKTFAISSLPIEKFRVNFNESIETPTIKFRWRRRNEPELQHLMDRSVIYAVITCKKSDWPTNIKLPLN